MTISLFKKLLFIDLIYRWIIYIYVLIYIYVYVYRERERERERFAVPLIYAFIG